MTIRLTLPIPISINKAYNTAKKGRVKTPELLEWHHRAGYAAVNAMREHGKICDHNLMTRFRHTTGRGHCDLIGLSKAHQHLTYTVNYDFFFKNDRLRDVLNFEKLTTDFLVQCGFMLDDSFIVEARIRRMENDEENPRVEIEINTIDSTKPLG